jgi:hypothetical protein
MRTFRKFGLTVGAAVAAVALAAGPAFAHECFNASRTERANTVIAQHSHGWFDIHTSQFLGIFVLFCIQAPSADCPPPPPLSAADLAALQSGNPDTLVGEILGFVPPETAVTNLLAFTSEVETEAACLAVPTHFLTLNNATAAGGAEKNGGKVLTDGKGIDHFPEVYGEQLMTAYQTVLLGTPSAC